MRRVPWTAAGTVLLLATLVVPAAQPDRKRTEAETRAAELKAMSAQVERARQQAKADAERIERQGKALRVAELAVTRASGDLSSLRDQRAERAAARKLLVEERSRRQAQKDATKADLANQLRAAYFMGSNEPLKLLLNQRSPAQFGRNLTYYGYLGRLRAGQIAAITENIAQIDELTDKIDEEDARLADNMALQKKTLEEREAARRQRDEALAAIKREAGSRAEELRRLQVRQKQAEQQLEQLLEKLRREAQSAPPADPNSPFAARKGKLSWPVAGRIAAGKSVSDGIEIDAARGSEVRAVHAGTVIHADYMGGLGNLIIVDHGSGYWTVYGYNEELYKAEGAKVKAGEKIATVGDSGGQPRPRLYFEIRHSANAKSNPRPVNPRGWFSTAAPPAG